MICQYKKFLQVSKEQDDYYWALAISPEIDFEIHLKRSTGLYFDNIIIKFY